LGCEARLLGIAKDTLADHVHRIGAGLAGSDVVITIGGVSMGTHDFTRPALEQLGATIELWRVAMRPGKPIAFARKDAVRIFGLPGNPVSSFVSFELFVRPALLRMQGLVGAPRPLWPAQLVDSEMKKKAGLEVYARGSARLMSGKLVVRLVEGQGSHHMSALADANCLVRFPRDVERVAAGGAVEVMLLADPLVAADML
ncbi:MAG TPA: molybdopterin-binding protein, partial [Myxococcota bacterium]